MDNVEFVRRGFDAFERGERSWPAEHCAPDIEWHPALGVLLSQQVYRGPDEVCRLVFDEIPSVLTGFRSEVIDLREVDDERVLAVVRFRGTAASAGMEVEQVFGQVYTVRKGLLREMRSYPSEAEAVAAVGATAPG